MNIVTKPQAQAGNENGPRVNWAEQSPELVRKFTEVPLSLRASSIEESIVDLANIRASQLNGCSFCLDMHVKQAKMHGERELRLYHLAARRDSTLFGPRERAALAWTEVLTKLPEQGVPDEIYNRVRTQLSEKEIPTLASLPWSSIHGTASTSASRPCQVPPTQSMVWTRRGSISPLPTGGAARRVAVPGGA
jgi:AhpD family alkylhydroperoxidase